MFWRNRAKSSHPTLTGVRRWVVLAILPGLVVFGIGYYAGKFGIPPRHYAAGQTGQPADFTDFFQAKQLIEDKYPGAVKSQDLVTGATKGLVQGLGDPYSAFLDKSEVEDLQSSLTGEVEGIGVEIGLRNDQVTVIAPVAGSPAEQAGIKAGDVITAVGDRPTVGQSLDEVADQIRGKAGTKVAVEVQTGEQAPRSLELIRATVKSPSVSVRYQDDIAIIGLSRFGDDTKEEFSKAVTDVQAHSPRGVVLDLRGNPGGYLEGAIDVSSVFLKSGVVVKEQLKGSTEERSVSNDGRLADLPLVILIDKGTASAAEITAGALRDDRGIKLVGEQTFGKGSVQELIDLSGGTVLKLTIAEWLTPKGTSISKEGLKPDQTVSSDNPDAQLQAALKAL